MIKALLRRKWIKDVLMSRRFEEVADEKHFSTLVLLLTCLMLHQDIFIKLNHPVTSDQQLAVELTLLLPKESV